MVGRPTVDDLRNRTLLDVAPAAINALMDSSCRLMDQFYDSFGASLNVSRYLRTNQSRDPRSKLDNVSAIPELLVQFTEVKIYYDLWRNKSSKVSRQRYSQASEHDWNSMWTAEFGLSPISTENPNVQFERVGEGCAGHLSFRSLRSKS